MRCDYEYDSGAYVLGALSPGERAAYERHLAGCPTCREAVGDVAVLPGLLGRLDPAGLETLSSGPSNESRMPQLLAAVSDSRRREKASRRWRSAGSMLAAACLALFVGLGVGILRDGGPAGTTPQQVQLASMRSVAPEAPVTAEVGLTTTRWGTVVTMHCSYTGHPGENKAYTYRLIAYDTEGDEEQISSWSVSPGADLKLSGMTSFSGAKLSKIVLTKKDGTPLLEYRVP
ncbi:anti-sigma factor family protein [Micromonospora sp. CPCC 206061]|uniref:anti-sigma factor family protein n=1 Tax=Micromonospora sp. CPCC 206061 TaxID=3122410 RepID=UPI002FF1F58C